MPANSRLSRLAMLAPLLLAMACLVDGVDLRQKRCPCATGWFCNTKTGLCVFDEGHRDAAVTPASDAQGPESPPDASEADAGEQRDATVIDAAIPVDAEILDATRAADAEIADAMPGGGLLAYYRALACSTSSTALSNCDKFIDGNHTTGMAYQCSPTPNICSYVGDCAAEGCIADLWLGVDLGDARTISRVRFVSDWWSKRPKNYEVWVSNSASDVPSAGARMVAKGIARPNPWQCLAGNSCADADVPDWCCPNGPEAPQSPATTTEAKYDILDFAPTAGRYFYLLVRDTYSKPFLIMQELDFAGPTMEPL